MQVIMEVHEFCVTWVCTTVNLLETILALVLLYCHLEIVCFTCQLLLVSSKAEEYLLKCPLVLPSNFLFLLWREVIFDVKCLPDLLGCLPLDHVSHSLACQIQQILNVQVVGCLFTISNSNRLVMIKNMSCAIITVQHPLDYLNHVSNWKRYETRISYQDKVKQRCLINLYKISVPGLDVILWSSRLIFGRLLVINVILAIFDNFGKDLARHIRQRDDRILTCVFDHIFHSLWFKCHGLIHLKHLIIWAPQLHTLLGHIEVQSHATCQTVSKSDYLL